jgi:transcriptional regulator with XRE-family HTH domain
MLAVRFVYIDAFLHRRQEPAGQRSVFLFFYILRKESKMNVTRDVLHLIRTALGVSIEEFSDFIGLRSETLRAIEKEDRVLSEVDTDAFCFAIRLTEEQVRFISLSGVEISERWKNDRDLQELAFATKEGLIEIIRLGYQTRKHLRLLS